MLLCRCFRTVVVLSVALSVALSLSGCFGGAVSTAAGKGTTEQVTGVSWLWGLTTTHTHAVECPNGLAEVEVYWPWWGWIPQALTAGIVTPITKRYTCIGAKTALAPAAPAAPAASAASAASAAPAAPAAPAAAGAVR